MLDTFDFADTVIFNDKDPVKQIKRETLQFSYNCHPERSQRDPIYVEPMSFIQQCLREGKVRHRLPLRKGMGGKLGRSASLSTVLRTKISIAIYSGRTSFTQEDDDNLCYYISRKIPDKNCGGRAGNGVYISLEELVYLLHLLVIDILFTSHPKGEKDRNFAWAKRHSWDSWRTRYKNNEARFDYLINHHAKINPPPEHIQYHLRRGWSSKYQRFVETNVDPDEEFDTGEELDTEEELDLVNREADDETVHPETIPLRTKRQRPSSTRNSLLSASPAKKQRTDTHTQEPRRRDLRARGKGKTRVASLLDDADDQHKCVPHDLITNILIIYIAPMNLTPSTSDLTQLTRNLGLVQASVLRQCRKLRK